MLYRRRHFHSPLVTGITLFSPRLELFLDKGQETLRMKRSRGTKYKGTDAILFSLWTGHATRVSGGTGHDIGSGIAGEREYPRKG